MRVSRLSFFAKVLNFFVSFLGATAGGTAAVLGEVEIFASIVGGCIGGTAVHVDEGGSRGILNRHLFTASRATVQGFIAATILLTLTTQNPRLRTEYMNNAMTFNLCIVSGMVIGSAMAVNKIICEQFEKKNLVSPLSRLSFFARLRAHINHEVEQLAKPSPSRDCTL